MYILSQLTFNPWVRELNMHKRVISYLLAGVELTGEALIVFSLYNLFGLLGV